MIRLSLTVLTFSGVLTLPLLDAAAKGTIVLLLAGLICLWLRRDSAATRHGVLTVAVCMMLIMPLLSCMLPQWRVLPAWLNPTAIISQQPTALAPNRNPAPGLQDINVPVADQPVITWPPREFPQSFGADSTTPHDISISADSAAAMLVLENQPAAAAAPGDFATSADDHKSAARLLQVLPLVWVIGVMGLLTRLALSALSLRSSQRRCSDGNQLLGTELAQAQKMLGLQRSVRLLLDPIQSMPIVWGLLQPRLRLPAEATNWPHEQLRSVLLHELAHLRRHDLMELMVTQTACAIHWYNPLVWIAGWRLHVERERACDDLVLASGVRPSTYAEHLLQIATQLSTSRWMNVCGLAMARKSSLEGRLLAVLSQKLNRRGTTLTWLIAAILLGSIVSVPIAMLQSTHEMAAKESADELDSQNDQGLKDEPVEREPQNENGRELFEIWKLRARTDGQIPGALIGQLGARVEEYIARYPNEAGTEKLTVIQSRFDSRRDWTQSEAITLLDEVASLATAPIGWASLPLKLNDFDVIKSGQPLPAALLTASWGEPVENGLRAAWLLEPQAEQYPLGTVLKVRVLFHNAGTQPVIFRTETWHQSDRLVVRDAGGNEIKTSSTWYTGITPLANYRLLPGEYCEVTAPGVAIGAGTYPDERSTGNLGIIIEAKEGDEVSFTCSVDAAEGVKFSRSGDPTDKVELWRKQVAERVASEAPLPTAAADREQLIRRVMLDLTGEPPAAEEVLKFVNDTAPTALDNLVDSLQKKEPTRPWTGRLPTGTTRFHVTAADPNAALKPRVATRPGRYVLGDTAHLQVRQVTTEDTRPENSAQILFFTADPRSASPHEPYQITLPDGLDSYAVIWVRGEAKLTIVEKNSVRMIDFSNPEAVKQEFITEDLSPEFRALLPAVLMSQVDAVPDGETFTVRLDTEVENQLDWGAPAGGLRSALMIRSPGDGKPEGICLVVQNVSGAPVRFVDKTKAERLRTLYLSDSEGILMGLSNDQPTMTDVTLQPHDVVFLSMMRGDSSEQVTAGLIEGIRKDSLQTWRAVLRINDALDGAWKGELRSGDSRCTVRDSQPQPKDPKAQALFKVWQGSTRLNGDIPGGLVRGLHDKVKEFIRLNEPDTFGGPSAQKMKPLEPRFANTGDWKAADVVALMDEIAAASTIPLETTLEHLQRHTLQGGTPLPASLQNADWGEPLASGLRMAYVLEPRAEGYHRGSEIKARILLHNAGTEPVAFVTTGFQQPRHFAKLADGTELNVDSVEFLTLGRKESYRLAPGEYCEIYTPGLGIGTRNPDRDDWANVRAGSWILVAEGDEVLFTPGAAMLYYEHDGESSEDWWLSFISERLNREAPIPTDTKEREYLLYRVVRDLFGTAPYTTEGDAFAADKSPDALQNLASLLVKHPYGKHSHGLIRGGTTTFRVLSPDSDAATRPRIANNPGWYSLANNVKFSVTRKPLGNTVRNEASMIYFQEGKENVVHNVPLPDGYGSWAAATMKGSTELWIGETGTLRKYDFDNPLQTVETRYEGEKLDEAPISKDLRAVLHSVISGLALDTPNQKPLAPAADASGRRTR